MKNNMKFNVWKKAKKKINYFCICYLSQVKGVSINQSYSICDPMWGCEIWHVHSYIYLAQEAEKKILRKNQYIQRENKGLRRSKYLALETVREATGARNRVGDVGRIRETLLSHKPETKVYK